MLLSYCFVRCCFCACVCLWACACKTSDFTMSCSNHCQLLLLLLHFLEPLRYSCILTLIMPSTSLIMAGMSLCFSPSLSLFNRLSLSLSVSPWLIQLPSSFRMVSSFYLEVTFPHILDIRNIDSVAMRMCLQNWSSSPAADCGIG